MFLIDGPSIFQSSRSPACGIQRSLLDRVAALIRGSGSRAGSLIELVDLLALNSLRRSTLRKEHLNFEHEYSIL